MTLLRSLLSPPSPRGNVLFGAALLLAAGACGPQQPADGTAQDGVNPEAGGAGAAVATRAAGGAVPAFFEAWDLGLAAVVCGRPEVPTILEVNGGGVALFDGDGDGDLEILLVSPGAYPASGAVTGGSNRLYRNDGGHFTDVTAGSGVDVEGFCNGVAVGDPDGDGDRDLYLTRWGGNVLLVNQGNLRFSAAPDAAGAAGDAWSTSAVFCDFDRDGDADLYVANYLAVDPDRPPLHGVGGKACVWKQMSVMCGPQGLAPQVDRYYRNEGGRFVEATAAAGFGGVSGYGLGAITGDFDNDGWPDLYVSNDSMPNFLFLGQGDGTVRESGMLSGTALSGNGREQAGMGIAAGDLQGDGLEELMVTNFSGDANSVYVNEGAGLFRDQADPSGLGGPSRALLGWGVAFVDVDLDGDLDVIAANGHVYPQADAPGTDTSYAQPDRLWLNDGRGRFSAADWPGDMPRVSRALAVGDLDDDGVQDLVILQRNGVPQVWRGLADGSRTLRISIAGPPGNPDGCGVRLQWRDDLGERVQVVRTDGGFQASGDPRRVFAWRGPGQLTVSLPDGRQMTRSIDAPGALRWEWPDS